MTIFNTHTQNKHPTRDVHPKALAAHRIQEQKGAKGRLGQLFSPCQRLLAERLLWIVVVEGDGPW